MAMSIDIDGDDDDGLFVLIEGLDRAPERHEFLLKRIKLRGGVLCGKAGGQSNESGIGIHLRRAYRTWQATRLPAGSRSN